MPAGHVSHDEAFAALRVPPGHVLHDAAPLRLENVPVRQTRHSDDDGGAALPAGQSAQKVAIAPL